MSKSFTLNWEDFRSSLITILFTSLVVMGLDIIAVGDINKVNYNAVINTGIIAGITGIVSLLKSFLTNSQGKLAGIKIK